MQARHLHLARRSTAPHSLDWQVLDVEEEEWEQRVGVAGVPPAPPGLAMRTVRGRPCAGPAATQRISHRAQMAWLLAMVALLIVGGVAAWVNAEQGLAAMDVEVRQTVFVEALRAQHIGAERQLDSDVQSVAFQDGTARTDVVVTQTLASGQVSVNRHTRFYQQTPSGWRQVKPRAEFWGAPMALDTRNLHLEYRTLDHAAVEAVAAQADELVTQVYGILGLPLPATAVTIEVVDELIAPTDLYWSDGSLAVGRIRVPSPVLIATAPDRSDADVLAWSLRRALVETAYEQALATTPVKPQWMPLAEGIRSWLLLTPLLPLAPDVDASPSDTVVAQHLALGSAAPRKLLMLMGPRAWQQTYVYRVNDTYVALVQSESTPRFINFVAERYGAGQLGPLFRGFSQYERWDSLAPAVFDMSSQELEAAWQTTIPAGWPTN